VPEVRADLDDAAPAGRSRLCDAPVILEASPDLLKFLNVIARHANRIIHIKLQFSQWEYPLAGVGGGALYDYYQLQTRVAPRIIQ